MDWKPNEKASRELQATAGLLKLWPSGKQLLDLLCGLNLD
jgi:hypothetical protein